MATYTVNHKNSTARCVVYMPDNTDRSPMVEFYRSNRVKRPERFLTRNPEKSVTERFARMDLIVAHKAERRATRASMKRDLSVGDILSSSFGYSMTLVHFYRVTKLVGNMSVELEELEADIVEGDGWTGKKAPDLNSKGSKLDGKFRVTRGSTVKIDSSEYAYKWDGNAKYFNTMD